MGSGDRRAPGRQPPAVPRSPKTRDLPANEGGPAWWLAARHARQDNLRSGCRKQGQPSSTETAVEAGLPLHVRAPSPQKPSVLKGLAFRVCHGLHITLIPGQGEPYGQGFNGDVLSRKLDIMTRPKTCPPPYCAAGPDARPRLAHTRSFIPMSFGKVIDGRDTSNNQRCPATATPSQPRRRPTTPSLSNCATRPGPPAASDHPRPLLS